MIYLIQGVWFQEKEKLDIGFDEAMGEVAVLQTIELSSVYMGAFEPDLAIPGFFEGCMVDRVGGAELVAIQLTEDTLSFSKLYHGREDCIDYTFKKQPDGTWEGEYIGSNPKVGRGKSRCILTPVPDDFLIRNN